MVAIVPIPGHEQNNGHTNGVSSAPETVKPLNVVIVGGGIGGMMAAIGLRRAGHLVTILEQWDGASETGAAIHLAPNANGLLRRWGMYPETFGANNMENLAEYDMDGTVLKRMDLRGMNAMWQHPWQLVHRVHLHNKLRNTATGTEGPGTPANLRYSSKVTAVDPSNATVTLATGETIQGDAIIGADGVWSQTRKMVKGGHVQPFSSGKSAFRFLIPRKDVLADPLTKKFAEKNGELIMAIGDDRKIVVYPCHDNTLLNFVCIHPESETAAPDDSWNAGGSKRVLLEVYSKFDEASLALLNKADASTLKVWRLLDMDILPTWVNDKLALLGDAAHPFLPHQGQGGAVAIEDAVALTVVLPLGTKPSDVPERLKLYEQFRYERANKIQEYTRVAGRDRTEPGSVDMQSYTVYNFQHDEWDSATKKFEQWQWTQNPNLYWRMPVSFGPFPGPRQTLYTHTALPARHSTFVTASIKFKTSRTFLQNLFPTESFRFKGPGTVAFASISQTSLRKMEWLGGSGYNHIGLYIHGVEYVKKDGTTINGTYLPLLFESLTDPIISGREELGMPKVFCTIDVRRRENTYSVRTGWQGAMFGMFDLEDLTEQDPSADKGTIGGEPDAGIFAYKYSPAVGERGKADAAYATVTSHEEDAVTVPSTVEKVFKAGKCSIKFDTLTQQDLPTLHHIVAKLAQIPIYEYIAGKVVEGCGVPDVSSARRIE